MSSLMVVRAREAVSVRETADVLGVCVKTVRRMILRGSLPAFRTGRHLRIAKVDIVEFRKRNRVN